MNCTYRCPCDNTGDSTVSKEVSKEESRSGFEVRKLSAWYELQSRTDWLGVRGDGISSCGLLLRLGEASDTCSLAGVRCLDRVPACRLAWSEFILACILPMLASHTRRWPYVVSELWKDVPIAGQNDKEKTMVERYYSRYRILQSITKLYKAIYRI